MRSTANRADDLEGELPLAARLRMIRRARRRRIRQRRLDEAAWILAGALMAFILATELIAAVGKV